VDGTIHIPSTKSLRRANVFFNPPLPRRGRRGKKGRKKRVRSRSEFEDKGGKKSGPNRDAETVVRPSSAKRLNERGRGETESRRGVRRLRLRRGGRVDTCF